MTIVLEWSGALLGLRRAWRVPVMQPAALPCQCGGAQASRHGS